MQENSAESQPERAEVGLVPRELFFRVLDQDPLAEAKWDNLQKHLKNLQDVDYGVMASHSIGVNKISLAFFDFIVTHDEYIQKIPEETKREKLSKVRDLIDLGSRLHDIGKGTMLENGHFKYREILMSAGDLSSEQRKLIDEHSADGADILSEIGLPTDIVRIAKEHHNKEDRSVWHLPTEIITIADVLESVTSTKRKYIKTPFTKKDAFFLVLHDVLNRFGGTRIRELYPQWEPAYANSTRI